MNFQPCSPRSGRWTVVEDGLTAKERTTHKAMNDIIRRSAGLTTDDSPPVPLTGMNAFLRSRGKDANPPGRLTYEATSLAAKSERLLSRLFSNGRKPATPKEKE